MKKALLVLAMVLLSTAAWGETKYSLEELQNLERNLYPNKSKALNQPWSDSRYRLEKNEVTGEYRITENKNGEWKEIENDNTWNCPNWRVPLSMCKRESEERIRNYLDRLRKKEQEDKAWRPIK